jgi:hypothetical protein
MDIEMTDTITGTVVTCQASEIADTIRAWFYVDPEFDDAELDRLQELLCSGGTANEISEIEAALAVTHSWLP